MKALETFHSALRLIGVAYGDIGQNITRTNDQNNTNNHGLGSIVIGEDVSVERIIAHTLSMHC